MEITREHAEKVLEIVDCGLIGGAGTKPVAGMVCVEQVVSMALGLPFTDHPDTCVHPAVSSFKRALNDKAWSSNKARAKGLRRIAVAQLGSNTIDGKKFHQALQRLTIQRIVPIALRAAAKKNPWHAEELEASAVECEATPTRDVALKAREVTRRIYATDAAADAAVYAADAAAVYAAAADAAAAAAYAAAYADAAERDRILTISAECGLEALRECGSPGIQWVDMLCEKESA